MKSEEEIKSLPKNERAYYHILNDLKEELRDLEELIALDNNWSVTDSDFFCGRREGLIFAINLINRAIADLEYRSNS